MEKIRENLISQSFYDLIHERFSLAMGGFINAENQFLNINKTLNDNIYLVARRWRLSTQHSEKNKKLLMLSNASRRDVFYEIARDYFDKKYVYVDSLVFGSLVHEDYSKQYFNLIDYNENNLKEFHEAVLNFVVNNPKNEVLLYDISYPIILCAILYHKIWGARLMVGRSFDCYELLDLIDFKRDFLKQKKQQ